MEGLHKSSLLYEEEDLQIAYAAITLQCILMILVPTIFILTYSLLLRQLLQGIVTDAQHIGLLLSLLPAHVIDTDPAVAELMSKL